MNLRKTKGVKLRLRFMNLRLRFMNLRLRFMNLRKTAFMNLSGTS